MELKTGDGKVYYQNSILKITQWTRPDPDPDTDPAPETKTVVAVAAANEAARRGDEVETKAAAAAELHTVSYNSMPAAPSASRTAGEKKPE